VSEVRYSYLGEREQAADNAQRALVAARQYQDDTTRGKAYQTLLVEGLFAGPYQDTIAYAQQAVSCLEQTEERWWLGFALFGLGLLYHVVGYFHLSLQTATRLATLGQAIGDRRLLSKAAQNTGWSLATQGEWEAGIVACQEALSLAPDAYETAWTLMLLGFAYLEKGEIVEAVSVLQQAAKQAILYRSLQVQSWVNTYLGEAYNRNGQYEKARDCVHQGLALAQEIKNPYGIGLAHRILGQIAQSQDNPSEAKRAYDEALQTFSASQVRFEQARTHLDLASLAHTQGDHNTATMHLSTAYAWFNKLQVPKWVEKTEQLAREYGVTLTDVALEELTEGEV
jgi:tetratricopeptide (TPR) repeat protein